MKKENKDIKIEFFTNKESQYNTIFMNKLYEKIINEKKHLLEELQLKNVRKVNIRLYDNREDFIKTIRKFYIGVNIPTYCKGTIQNGEIYFLIDVKLKEGTYEYELELRKIIHEYIHILYNEYVLISNTRITWLDEGLALNLSKQKGRFEKERYPILESKVDKINLNNLQHEKQTFVKEDINGYDISYLSVKYLLETLSKEEFNDVIRDSEKLLKMRRNHVARCKKIF